MDKPLGNKPTENEARDLELLAGNQASQFAGSRRSIDRTLQVFKYYSTTQMASRLLKRMRAKAGGGKPDKTNQSFQLRNNAQFAKLLEVKLKHRHPLRVETACQQIPHGAITLLNQTREFGLPLDWSEPLNPRPSHLWRFQLQYQEYLLDLAADSQQQFESLIFQIIDGWLVARHESGDSTDADAWHPYCISRRAPVWLMLLAHMSPDESLRRNMLSSVVAQMEFLSKNLETDLRGNHLLENLHALAVASAFFSGPAASRWEAIATSRLGTELTHQVLSSGEHYERSPMYQCVVLGNLLQLAIVTANVSPQLHSLAMSYAKPMLEFIIPLLHPDGEIPLFSDSCFGESPSTAEIVDLANMAGIDSSLSRFDSGARQVGDYWVHRSNNDCVIWDCGQVAATGLPGHGHCDLLNFEASISGRRFIVDSGNFSYDEDSMRRYCRSSVAHNVLTVDNLDHCDVWSIFRMGFRGTAKSFRMGRRGGFDWAIATHDAYRRNGVPGVTRLFACNSNRMWICIDYVDRPQHELTGYIHFAPDVNLGKFNVASSVPTYRCTAASEEPFLVSFSGVQSVQRATGWYCDHFGSRARNPAIMYSGNSAQTGLLGWLVRPADTAAELQLNDDPANPAIRLKLESETITFEINLL